MSKGRRERRAARERETAIRAASRAAEAERRERRAARKKRIHRLAPGFGGTGRQTGTLARRRRTRTAVLLLSLFAVNALVWVVRPDWEARMAALVVTVLVAPLVAGFLFRRR